MPGLTVGSWNIWGMPIGSYAVLSRPSRCGRFAVREAAHGSEELGRVVLCFQEAFAWKAGWALPLVHLAAFLERRLPKCCVARPTNVFNPKRFVAEALRVNSCTTLLALLGALLPALCLPLAWFRWDETKRLIIDECRRLGMRHSAGGGGRSGITSRCTKLLDSGLLLVSTERILASGFTPFERQEGEGAANKGVLWAVLAAAGADARGTDEVGELVVTTHMHATDADVRGAQRAQLLAMIAELRSSYRPSVVVVCGDFNEDALLEPFASRGGFDEAMRAPPLGLVRLSESSKGTCMKDDGSGEVEALDHIYAAPGDAAGRGSAPLSFRAEAPVPPQMSDHSLLFVRDIALEPGHAGSRI